MKSTWNSHCGEMNKAYDAKAAELKAQGWKQNGRGINQYFTRNGETVILCRQLGSNVWYVETK